MCAGQEERESFTISVAIEAAWSRSDLEVVERAAASIDGGPIKFLSVAAIRESIACQLGQDDPRTLERLDAIMSWLESRKAIVKSRGWVMVLLDPLDSSEAVEVSLSEGGRESQVRKPELDTPGVQWVARALLSPLAGRTFGSEQHLQGRMDSSLVSPRELDELSVDRPLETAISVGRRKGWLTETNNGGVYVQAYLTKR